MRDAIDTYDSRRSTVHAPNGIVATSQPLAAAAGVNALRSGGNAFDAAVTAATTLTVVEPFSTGLGGDVFALYRTADGEVGAMSSIGTAPTGVTLETLRDDIRGETPSSEEPLSFPDRGPHTITVPGSARGWESLLNQFGTISLRNALEPAIGYAEDGFPVTEVIANQWSMWADHLVSERARETYLPDGSPPTAGERVTLSPLAETYRLLGDRGSDAVYEGPIGEQIVDEVQSRGGYLSEADLASFEARFVDPISTTYNGTTVYQLPPPNQGPIALEALNIAEELRVDEYPAESVDETHYLIEAMKRAFHDGHRFVADPEYESVPAIWSKSHAKRRAETITDRAATDVSGTFPGADGDTVLITAADRDGNVVSLINSLFKPFGSGLTAGKSGVLLQNRGRSFSLQEDAPNRFAPGKRPFHTLIPSVVKFDENDWAAFGVMGGYMQPQGHLQVLSSIVDRGAELQPALDGPRWRYRENGDLAVESRMNETVLTKLVRRGHSVRVEMPDEFGGGQIARFNDGVLSGATDPRKDGIVSGY